MRNHEKPAGGLAPVPTPSTPEQAQTPPKGKRKRKDKIVRTTGGKFAKGHSANPTGAGGGRPKQIFHTTKPWKQAIMREFRAMTDASNVDELQATAKRLITEARESKYPINALIEIGNRLDGAPEREPAAPQQNTLQLVMNSIRVLNLTAEQRNEFVKQLTAVKQLDSDGGGERSGGAGSTPGD